MLETIINNQTELNNENQMTELNNENQRLESIEPIRSDNQSNELIILNPEDFGNIDVHWFNTNKLIDSKITRISWDNNYLQVKVKLNELKKILKFKNEERDQSTNALTTVQEKNTVVEIEAQHQSIKQKHGKIGLT